jgi:hypothetical protein
MFPNIFATAASAKMSVIGVALREVNDSIACVSASAHMSNGDLAALLHRLRAVRVRVWRRGILQTP